MGIRNNNSPGTVFELVSALDRVQTLDPIGWELVHFDGLFVVNVQELHGNNDPPHLPMARTRTLDPGWMGAGGYQCTNRSFPATTWIGWRWRGYSSRYYRQPDNPAAAVSDQPSPSATGTNFRSPLAGEVDRCTPIHCADNATQNSAHSKIFVPSFGMLASAATSFHT